MEDLNSPRRELSNGGLKSVVTLLVRRQNIFFGSYWTPNPAVQNLNYRRLLDTSHNNLNRDTITNNTLVTRVLTFYKTTKNQDLRQWSRSGIGSQSAQKKH